MRKLYIKIFGLFLLFVLYNEAIFAQFTCSLKAPNEVNVGQPFQISFVLNEKPSSLPKMNFQNFSVVNGPSVSSSSSVSIINGKMTSSSTNTYTYVLVANKEGTFTIPSITFSANNEQAKSNAVTIRVVSSSSTNNSQQSYSSNNHRDNSVSSSSVANKEDYFIRAHASNTRPYVGEEVVLHYKLYISTQVRGYQFSPTSMPSANNCWTYELGDKNQEPPRSVETINGRQYYVYTIRSIAAYPQKSGSITLSPLKADLAVQVIVQQQRSSGDPFFDAFFGAMSQVQNMTIPLTSNSISLNVKELPAGQPVDFDGVVGNFQLKSALSRNTLSANDATNLQITISGSGNLQYINAPKLNFPADIDVHEPKVTDRINTTKSGVNGSRTFEYVLIPRNAGEYQLPPAAFSFFNKSTGKYQTLSTESYTLNVEKAKEGQNMVYSSANKEDIKILGNDIRHIKTDVQLNKNSNIFFASSLYFVLLFLPIVLLLVFVILLRKKIEDNKNVVLVKDRKAAKTAKKRLRKAENLLKLGKKDEFYEEISQVLWGYVSDKFHIPLSQLSLETAEEKLLARNMNPESVDIFLTTLKECEYVRFAPSADITPEKMYEKTFIFITNIEKQLR